MTGFFTLSKKEAKALGIPLDTKFRKNSDPRFMSEEMKDNVNFLKSLAMDYPKPKKVNTGEE